MYKLLRFPDNPILSPEGGLPWEREGVFNPGAIKFGKQVYLLYRAVGENEFYVSRLGLAKSDDGIKFIRSLSEPIFEPYEDFDKWGVEDPRITKIGDDYYITYVAVAKRIMEQGEMVKRFIPLETSAALLKTRDFKSFENLGIISSPGSDNKDTTIFPRKINGLYYMLHRPNRWTRDWFNGPYEKYVEEGLPCDPKDLPSIPSIWIASSLDLKTWSNHKLLMTPELDSDVKIGPGVPPIETKEGWLLIYHHVQKDKKSNRLIYSVRAALLDINDPSKLISKLDYDILTPEMPYENEKDSGIVFPNGSMVKGDTLFVYYGASDRYVCLATGSLSELISELNIFTRK